jgi:hypothetical protein
MKRYLLAAAAVLAIGGTAYANPSDEYRCMRDGPGSQACEWAQQQNERQNDYWRDMQERSRRAQDCATFGRNCD